MTATRTIQDDISIVALLKVCAKHKDLAGGSKIHADVLRKGLFGRNLFVDTAFINLYAKCGALIKAQLYFDELPVRSVVSWNALIAGYAHHEHEEGALNCFQQMQDEGLSPNAVTFACILKACNGIGTIKTGVDVHAEIARQEMLKSNQILGNALVAMYVRCGKLARARQIFDELPVRNVVSWTALIAGYCDDGQSAEAMYCFEQMKREGISPDAVTFASVLKVCGTLGAADKGQEIHTEITRKGWLGRARMLGNAVVDMYSKCGALLKAHDMFKKLPFRDVVSWTSLIAGYAHFGHHVSIFELFNRMLRDGIQPNVVTFTVVLNACSYLGLVAAGQTYFESMSKGYGIIPTSDHKKCMVDLYGHEGQFDMAMAVIREVPFLNNSSVWSSLLDACKKWGNEKLGGWALHQGVQIDDKSPAFSSLPKEAVMWEAKATRKEDWAVSGCPCAREDAELFCSGASRAAQPLQGLDDLHEKLARDSWESVVGLSGPSAQELMIRRTNVDEHSEIGEVYTREGLRTRVIQGLSEDSLFLEEFVPFDFNSQGHQEEIAFVGSLKECTQRKDLYTGSRFHANILKSGLLSHNIFVGNTLLNMYAKCGALGKARHVFSELSIPNVVSWTALIVGYCEHGHGEEALKCFEQMKIEGLFPDAVTFGCILKAIGSKTGVEKGQEIHVELVREGLLEQRTLLGNALVHMYAKCGALVKAQEVFDKLSCQDVVSWTALISGLSDHGQFEQALKYLEKMKLVGLSPNAVTFTCILKACGSLRAAEKGKEIHAEILRKGLLGKNSVLGTGLVHMYARCGALQKAQEVFDELPVQNVVSWNTLIAGYCHYGQSEEALNRFEKMKHKGVTPDAVTFTCLLKSCGSKRAIKKGDQLYVEISHKGLLQRSILLGNAVVDMYAKGGALEKAQQVFDELLVRSLASWTSLIAGYCQHGHCEEALNSFEQMKNEGFSPDGVTFACILKACGSSGALEKGEQIHAEISREGSLGKASLLGIAIVNMYAKCGALAKAQEVFDKLPAHDAISWTALITGYCDHGLCEKALYCFEQMKHEGFAPDSVALTVILKACGNVGAAEIGQEYFETLDSCYGLIPTSQHYSSVVDILSQGGNFDKAMAVIKGMPSSQCLPVWFALLGACQKWGNVKLAQFAFDCALQLDRRSAIAFICMSNIYAGAGSEGKKFKSQKGICLAKRKKQFRQIDANMISHPLYYGRECHHV